MFICRCNKCDNIFEDTNPQINAINYPEIDIPSLEPSENIDEGGLHACPNCQTDAYLQDDIIADKVISEYHAKHSQLLNEYSNGNLDETTAKIMRTKMKTLVDFIEFLKR
jgi:hypothetical protein